MKSRDAVRATLATRFRNQHRQWLLGEGNWPIELSLGCPTEAEAQRQPEAARAWVAEWNRWQGTGEITWCERKWRKLGTQRLPLYLALRSPEEVALWIGEDTRWRRARARYEHLTARWPAIATTLARYFDALADYDDRDVVLLEAVLDWLIKNPCSGRYPRQIPVAGMNSKWLDGRKGIVVDLLSAVRAQPQGTADFYSWCGLKALPQPVRLLLLDARLRQQACGLRDFSACLEELVQAPFEPRRIYLIENLQTGLALEDIPESIAFMGLGYGVGVLARIPWVANSECIYWGDIDTHGLAILSNARAQLPNMRSLMMDIDTLVEHRSFWGREPEQCAAYDLPHLTQDERALYSQLKQGTLGPSVRLEQEHIDWSFAEAKLRRD